MKKLSVGFILFLIIIGISSCEKDDICVDADTPLLVIDFINAADTSASKTVPDLRVVGLGQTVTVNTVTDRTDLSTISIPLKTTEDTTSFLLIRNSASDDDGFETGDIDTINITYSRMEDFKSRGCGFVVNYELNSATLEINPNNWISDIEIVRTQVINSDSTHVKIFH
ncbi:DUF6452 family protein [Maribacter aestuarii]|uniref:DUF6452 family protein n=1 Tax=Maribacter aestuarii TaxID=1130723 RepID=UPI00248CE4CD|nr:DUF6452 family protein [Maribacter aestuarii]